MAEAGTRPSSGDPPGDLPRGRTALFVRRPILAFVLNALIVLAGVAAMLGQNGLGCATCPTCAWVATSNTASTGLNEEQT